MGFLTGFIAGAAASLGSIALVKKQLQGPNRPPWISEYYVRSIWLESAGFYETHANPPLTEPFTEADIVIVGGGLTGLSAAYHLIKQFPDKHIILLEAARCSYGASGRNGGILQDFDNTLIMELYDKKGIDAARNYFIIDRQGPALMRTMIKENRISCDLEESGLIELAADKDDFRILSRYHEAWQQLGIGSDLLTRDQISEKLKTSRYYGGLYKKRAGMLNPAKYAVGLKSVIEKLSVQVYEHTKVVGIDVKKVVTIETEFGQVKANTLVIATNAYSHKIGFFKRRIFPVGTYIVATEPLDETQINSIGWHGREAMFDIRKECNYMRLTTDNRIVIGGGRSHYFYGNRLSSGNHKASLRQIETDLSKIWPQLKDVKITHRWGGTLAVTLDSHPTIGVMGERKNVYYGVGYSGHGVSWSQLAGKIISQLYAGEDTEFTRFYCVNRKPPYLPGEPLRSIGYHLYRRLFL